MTSDGISIAGVARPPGVRWVARDRWRGAVPAMAAVAAVSLGLWAVPGAGDVWHWLPHRVGLMFPSCGLTRATLALLHGDVTRAARFNPAAFVVLPAALAVVPRWAVGRVSGRWLDIELRVPRRWAALAIVVVLALWARQQASAELLVAG